MLSVDPSAPPKDDFQLRSQGCHREDLRATRRMRVTFDALVEGMAAHVRAGEG